jgi:hypothetical protein
MHISAEFVRYSAAALRPLSAQLDGERSPIVPTAPAVSCQRRERSRWTENCMPLRIGYPRFEPDVQSVVLLVPFQGGIEAEGRALPLVLCNADA